MGVSADSLTILGRRGRGRPRVDEPRSTVSTWVWAKHHDWLVKQAAAREISVSALVREIVEKSVQNK